MLSQVVSGRRSSQVLPGLPRVSMSTFMSTPMWAVGTKPFSSVWLIRVHMYTLPLLSGCLYLSFLFYWTWSCLVGLLERVFETAGSVKDLLDKFQLTHDKKHRQRHFLRKSWLRVMLGVSGRLQLCRLPHWIELRILQSVAFKARGKTSVNLRRKCQSKCHLPKEIQICEGVISS